MANDNDLPGSRKNTTVSDDKLDLDLSGSSELVPVEAVTNSNHNSKHNQHSLADSVAASKQIARMKEPKSLDIKTYSELKIIHPDMKEKNAVNLYRNLRTKLLQITKNRNFVVLITSVIEGGGATHIALNLASSFSFDSTKTALLLDCNLSNPSLDKILGVKIEHGITDFIENENISISEIIYSTGVHRLRLVPVGNRRESSLDYFTSIRMQILIEAMKRRYPDRFIFIDSPAIGQYADAKILADLCDFIILVVPYAGITESKLQQIINTLDKTKFAGVVFN